MFAPLLHLVFRNANGSLTEFSWYLVAVVAFVIGSGLWTLISPSSYAHFWAMGRQTRGSTLSPSIARIVGAAGIVAGLAWLIWMAFISEPGRLY